MRPWFFSIGDLVGLWRNTTAKQHADDAKAAEELFKEAEVRACVRRSLWGARRGDGTAAA